MYRPQLMFRNFLNLISLFFMYKCKGLLHSRVWRWIKKENESFNAFLCMKKKHISLILTSFINLKKKKNTTTKMYYCSTSLALHAFVLWPTALYRKHRWIFFSILPFDGMDTNCRQQTWPTICCGKMILLANPYVVFHFETWHTGKIGST